MALEQATDLLNSQNNNPSTTECVPLVCTRHRVVDHTATVRFLQQTGKKVRCADVTFLYDVGETRRRKMQNFLPGYRRLPSGQLCSLSSKGERRFLEASLLMTSFNHEYRYSNCRIHVQALGITPVLCFWRAVSVRVTVSACPLQCNMIYYSDCTLQCLQHCSIQVGIVRR